MIHIPLYITGFNEPGNIKLLSIELLYFEMFLLFSFMLFVIMILIDYIISTFNNVVNPIPIKISQEIISIMDIIFVMVPTILIFYILIPAVGYIFSYDCALFNNLKDSLDLTVIGHQWYWTYEYKFLLNDSLKFKKSILLEYTFDSFLDYNGIHRLLSVDLPLVIPVGTQMNVLITSDDVIHCWAIPSLGVKTDAIPGRIMTIDLKSDICGSFFGQCSELCGVNHVRMPIHVVSVMDIDFLIHLTSLIKYV